MAILTQSNSGDGPVTGWPIATPAPAGQHLAVCLAIKDTLNYESPKYRASPDEPIVMEIKDVTRFLFGLADGSLIQTSEMLISGHEKSKLVGTLTSWLGAPPPVGYDTEALIGQGVTLNVVAKVSNKGRSYSDVASVSPVMPQLANQVPNVAMFSIPEGDGPSAPAQPVAPVQPIQPAPIQTATQPVQQVVQPVQQIVQPAVQQPVQQPVQPIQPAQPQQATLGGQFTPPPTQTVPF